MSFNGLGFVRGVLPAGFGGRVSLLRLVTAMRSRMRGKGHEGEGAKRSSSPSLNPTRSRRSPNRERKPKNNKEDTRFFAPAGGGGCSG